MSRAPFQVLVYPFIQDHDCDFEYAIFRRSDHKYWQAIAGGGEGDETPLQAARRESFEEAGIEPEAEFIILDTIEPIPVTEFEQSALWGEDRFVIPQYCFGVRLHRRQMQLSSEHTEYRWLNYQKASGMIRFDGNRTALWELDRRLRGAGPHGCPPYQHPDHPLNVQVSACLAVIHQGCVCLLINPGPNPGEAEWRLPSATLQCGETLEAAAGRAFSAETDLPAIPISLLDGQQSIQINSSCSQIQVIFLGKLLHPDAVWIENTSSEEARGLCWFSLDELHRLNPPFNPALLNALRCRI